MSLFGKKSEASRAPDPICGVVIAAAGTAERMQGVDKILAPLGGEPVLVRAIWPFQQSPWVGEIVVVTRQELLVEVGRLCRDAGLSKVRQVCQGGDTRSASVLLGLGQLTRRCKLAAIHDAARPLVTQQLVDETILRAQSCGAAAPAIAVTDTIKTVERDLVTGTPDRAGLRAVQTPQVFDRDLIEAALTRALRDGAALTDDCQAVERLGMHVHLTQGSERNLKLTTPTDLALAGLLLEAEA